MNETGLVSGDNTVQTGWFSRLQPSEISSVHAGVHKNSHFSLQEQCLVVDLEGIIYSNWAEGVPSTCKIVVSFTKGESNTFRDLGSVLFDFCIPEFGAARGVVEVHRNAAKRIGFWGRGSGL